MDSDETFADLDDLSLEDVVVRASSDAIRAATGLGILPHFEVVPGDAGSWERGATSRVTCTFDGADHYLDCEEFAFHAPYAALKAMAYGRPEGVLTLASAFLVHYRAAAMSGELALRLISRESMPEDFGGGPGVEARIRASWRTVETLWPRELGSWHVAGIDGAAVNEIASRLVVTLRDSSFD